MTIIYIRKYKNSVLWFSDKIPKEYWMTPYRSTGGVTIKFFKRLMRRLNGKSVQFRNLPKSYIPDNFRTNRIEKCLMSVIK